jgi:hypothetical protein
MAAKPKHDTGYAPPTREDLDRLIAGAKRTLAREKEPVTWDDLLERVESADQIAQEFEGRGIEDG